MDGQNFCKEPKLSGFALAVLICFELSLTMKNLLGKGGKEVVWEQICCYSRVGISSAGVSVDGVTEGESDVTEE